MILLPDLKPIRVCFVCDEYPPAMHGGIGSMVQMTARDLVAQGHQARVIGRCSPDCPVADYEEDRGVQVWRIRSPRWRHGWPLSRYRVFRTVSQWARSREIDLVEVADFAGPAALWPKLPVPVIARLQGSATLFASEMNRNLKKSDYWLERASLRRADHVCAITQFAAHRTQEVFGFDDRPVEIVYNSVEIPTPQPVRRRSKNRVVFSGTLTYKKGVVPLFQAWEQVARQRPRARLDLYGKDTRTEDGQSMRSMLTGLLSPGVRDSVRFHGHTPRPQLLAALGTARVGVFPSFAETFGMAPAESMAAGCPTVYSWCGCGGELVRDGVDGLLVQPGRADELAAAIIRLLDDDELAARLGAAGQRRIREKFGRQELLARNIAFYRQCIEQSQNQGS